MAISFIVGCKKTKINPRILMERHNEPKQQRLLTAPKRRRSFLILNENILIHNKIPFVYKSNNLERKNNKQYLQYWTVSSQKILN